MNEILCRALLRARLTEEDVAAQLQVDPKTVRRWLEGRVPHMRHRWAIAAMLSVDETDLWPQLRSARTRPNEVVAIYPHSNAVPLDIWMRVLGSAQREIGILDHPGMLLAGDLPIMEVVAERAGCGVCVRICLSGSGTSDVAERATPTGNNAAAGDDRGESAIYAPLREKEYAELRVHRGIAYSSIYFADDQLLVGQHAYGIAARQVPVLYITRVEGGDMADSYLDAFEQVWMDAGQWAG